MEIYHTESCFFFFANWHKQVQIKICRKTSKTHYGYNTAMSVLDDTYNAGDTLMHASLTMLECYFTIRTRFTFLYPRDGEYCGTSAKKDFSSIIHLLEKKAEYKMNKKLLDSIRSKNSLNHCGQFSSQIQPSL